MIYQLNSRPSRTMIERSETLVMLLQYAEQPGLSPKVLWMSR